MEKLTGKVAVVTGAATGIGSATAAELAKRGCDVALITRKNRAGLENTAQKIREMGRKTSLHIADVGDREAMEGLPDIIEKEHGKIDILVNNAGVNLMGELEDVSLEDLDWIMNINFWGVVHGSKLFLPAIKRQSWGHICNIASLQGLLALTSHTGYSATKFAIRGFSEALRGELSPLNIGVSVVYPGLIKTGVVNSARVRGDDAAALQKNLGTFVDKYAMDSESCARRVVNGIEKNRGRILITGSTRFFDILKRLFPTTTDTLVAKVTRGGIPET
ncbi:MAG: SDR family NAD(P)-dependent oxidoreductase [Halieaceae bacterium]|jgi:short-subunit dehydrogenase|nr:SDR family NAD(P)-dependent oxidoreductase [Halieaceae bacterium]